MVSDNGALIKRIVKLNENENLQEPWTVLSSWKRNKERWCLIW